MERLYLCSSSLLAEHKATIEPISGISIGQLMASGQLVPDSFIGSLINKKVASSGVGLLFDGFPRTIEQAKLLQDIVKLEQVFLIDVPEAVILSRISQRWVHLPSGRTYSYDFSPPKIHGKDDETGEPLTLREDDKPEVVQRRLQLYQSSVQPLLEFYKASGLLHVFTGTESPAIYQQLTSYLNARASRESKE